MAVTFYLKIRNSVHKVKSDVPFSTGIKTCSHVKLIHKFKKLEKCIILTKLRMMKKFKLSYSEI